MNKLKITKFEQAAHVIEFSGQKLAVDFGYLTGQETIARIGPVSASLVTHQHTDHFDANNLKALAVPAYCPEDVAVPAKNAGVDAHSLREGETLQIGKFGITAVHSDHGPKVTKPVQNFAYIYQVGTLTGYFTGDIGSPSPLPVNELDFMILPVGGGFVFSVEQAADYIRSINYGGTVIPVHYDLPTPDPEAGVRFKALIGELCNVQVLDTGETLEVTP